MIQQLTGSIQKHGSRYKHKNNVSFKIFQGSVAGHSIILWWILHFRFFITSAYC